MFVIILDGILTDSTTNRTTAAAERTTSSSTLGGASNVETTGDGYSTIGVLPSRERTNSASGGYTTIHEVNQVKYAAPAPRIKRKPRVLERHTSNMSEVGFRI